MRGTLLTELARCTEQRPPAALATEFTPAVTCAQGRTQSVEATVPFLKGLPGRPPAGCTTSAGAAPPLPAAMQSPSDAAADAVSGSSPPAASAGAPEALQPSEAAGSEHREGSSAAERPSGDLDPVFEGSEEEDDAADGTDGAHAADAAEPEEPEAAATAHAATGTPATGAAAAKPPSIKNTCRVSASDAAHLIQCFILIVLHSQMSVSTICQYHLAVE